MSHERRTISLLPGSLAVLIISTFCLSTPTNLSAAARFPKRTVDSFFQTWLVERNETATINFFHQRAFRNRYMLAGCGDEYIKDDDRTDPVKVKDGVRKFIKDAFGEESVTLALPSDDPQEVFGDFVAYAEKSAINVPSRDKYFILSYRSFTAEARDKPFDRYFRQHYDSKTSFFSVAAVRFGRTNESEGLMYFLWARDGKAWRIVHLGFICQ